MNGNSVLRQEDEYAAYPRKHAVLDKALQDPWRKHMLNLPAEQGEGRRNDIHQR